VGPVVEFWRIGKEVGREEVINLVGTTFGDFSAKGAASWFEVDENVG
jgi:hypothetical protein